MRSRALVVGIVVAVGAVAGATAAGATGVDRAHLPLGDGKLGSKPAIGTVLRCEHPTTYSATAATSTPWIDAAHHTWSKPAKVAVRGSARWASSLKVTTSSTGTRLTGNGLPSTPTGVFPVQNSDPAYRYDQRLGWIDSWILDVTLPNPTGARSASCIDGVVGYSLLGVPIYSAVDGTGHDAVANEVEDACDGRASRAGRYYVRQLSRCYRASGRDAGLYGYALDGYGIYDEGEVATADLDACHGRTSVVSWHGKKVSMYHYVATADFPYLVGCFHGTPATLPPQGLGAVE